MTKKGPSDVYASIATHGKHVSMHTGWRQVATGRLAGHHRCGSQSLRACSCFPLGRIRRQHHRGTGRTAHHPGILGIWATDTMVPSLSMSLHFGMLLAVRASRQQHQLRQRHCCPRLVSHVKWGWEGLQSRGFESLFTDTHTIIFHLNEASWEYSSTRSCPNVLLQYFESIAAEINSMLMVRSSSLPVCPIYLCQGLSGPFFLLGAA